MLILAQHLQTNQPGIAPYYTNNINNVESRKTSMAERLEFGLMSRLREHRKFSVAGGW